MAKLLSNTAAEWVKDQVYGGDNSGRRRHPHIRDGDQSNDHVLVCRITGGGPLVGYRGVAYRTMSELRKDTAGQKGEAINLFPVEIGLDAYIPEGTIVLVHSVLCTVAGEGAEPEE